MIISSGWWIKITWDLFMMILVILNSVVFPIIMCFFNEDYDNKFVNGFDNFSLLCFWFDIILNFRTTYFDKDHDEIVCGKLIAKRYGTSMTFIIDLLASIPFG
jgi:hypothetical protein